MIHVLLTSVLKCQRQVWWRVGWGELWEALYDPGTLRSPFACGHDSSQRWTPWGCITENWHFSGSETWKEKCHRVRKLDSSFRGTWFFSPKLFWSLSNSDSAPLSSSLIYSLWSYHAKFPSLLWKNNMPLFDFVCLSPPYLWVLHWISFYFHILQYSSTFCTSF